MPCGGIYPIQGSWVEKHSAGGFRCLHCDAVGAGLWCEEWDAPLHTGCVEGFLKTPDGEIVLAHGHSIVLEPNGPEVFWDDVSGQLRDAKGAALFIADPRDGDPDTPIPYRPTSHKLN